MSASPWGEPDPDLGQRVKVYVMLAPLCPQQALEDELMAFTTTLRRLQKNRALEFVDALAHNANGKLIRGQFRPQKLIIPFQSGETNRRLPAFPCLSPGEPRLPGNG